MDKMSERRRELLKRSGGNIAEMTRKALVSRPEDPRTIRLRKELDDLQLLTEKKALEAERKMRDLEEQLRLARAENSRATEHAKDTAQLRAEIETLKAKLQTREQQLMSERERCEDLRQQQALNQQALMARLSQLESPSIGTPQTLATNQSREAKMVKLPSWMHLKK